MNFSKIICIEVKKYNDVQLAKISEMLGFGPTAPSDEYFTLQEAKKDKVERVYILEGESSVLALKFKKGVESQTPYYKDILFIYPKYRGLSKKEKDNILKVEPVDFFAKKSKSTVKSKTSTVSPVLDLDLILDKIGEFGINSLLKEEKDFLDNLSKQ